eukprot:15355137-Ditylum_brightwellii.AAC.1
MEQLCYSVPWSLMQYYLSNMVIIDCGICVEVDISDLDNEGSMNIFGYLKKSQEKRWHGGSRDRDICHCNRH